MTSDRINIARTALQHALKPADRELPDDITALDTFAAHVAQRTNEAARGQAMQDPGNYAGKLTAATTPEDFDRLVDELAHENARRAVLREAVSGNINLTLERTVTARLNDATGRIAATLTPAFDKAVKALTEAAAALPTGDLVFNADTVLNSGAGDAYRTAWDAITTLTEIGAIWDTTKYSDPHNLPRDLRPLLSILDVDNDVEGDAVNWQGKTLPAEQQEPAGNSLRVLNRAQTGSNYGQREGWDARRTIIEIARGDYPGIHLRLAANDTELRDRANRYKRAFTLRSTEVAGMTR